MPVHINSNHWGPAIFSIIDQTVFFHDGYHSPIPDDLNRNAHEIIEIIHHVTRNDKFLPSKWSKIKRFRVPMPNQPGSSSASSIGCGSCGVAVLCATRAKKCPARASPGRPGPAIAGLGQPRPENWPGPAWPWPARAGQGWPTLIFSDYSLAWAGH